MGAGWGSIARLLVAWATVAAVTGGGAWLAAATASVAVSAGFFLVLLAVVMWSAFGVVDQADALAERLGEPYGTLVLTLAIVIIEVALIGAVTLGTDEATLGRDTMFAVLMIVLNGVVGLGLLIGGWRYGAQAYNLEGASAYLAVIMPLAVIALTLPNFTTSTSAGTLSTTQSIAFAVFTLVLYGVFLALQTGRLRHFFVMPDLPADTEEHRLHGPQGSLAVAVAVLLLTLLPVVLLAKQLTKLLDALIAATHLPTALGGVVIALIVFTPEGLAALRAVTLNRMQRTINLCLGAAASTIGLTVPALLLIGVATGKTIMLGLSPAHTVLLALTLFLSTLTFSGARTTALNGAMHLGVFFVYLTLIFSP